MATTKRAFRRDAYLGVRLPDDDKRRLFEIARKKRRDASSLALEWIARGVRETEGELERDRLAQLRINPNVSPV